MTEVIKSSEIALYDNFGKISYSAINSSMTNFIANDLQDDNKFEMFKQICKNILCGDDDYNIVYFHNLVFNLTNQSPVQVNTVIINIFSDMTNSMYNSITESILNETFTIKQFVEKYQRYYMAAIKLAKELSYFDTCVLIDNNNKYSHVNLVRNYSFYKNVINRKYKYMDDKEYYLYEILTKLFEKNVLEIDTIIQLCKMYNFYIRLSYIVKNNKELMFNADINKRSCRYCL